MGSRDHLVPSTTVDRNGHSKTVWVRPSSGASSSMLSFAAPSLSYGYGDEEDEEEYEEYGHEWRNVGNPEEWATAGFDAEDAEVWSRAGFEPATAWKWSENNFDPREADEWRDYKFDDPDVAAEWRDATKHLKRVDMDDLRTLYEEKTESEDAAEWIGLLAVVQSYPDHGKETISDVIQTMDGEKPSAGLAYYSLDFPYAEWNLLAGAGIKDSDASIALYLQDAVDEYYQDEEGDEYVENRETFLSEALMWMDGAQALTPDKYKMMAYFIHEGKSPRALSNFISNSDELAYEHTDTCMANIVKANNWVNDISPAGASKKAKSESFEKFYTALTSIPEIDDLVADHGADKVEQAMQQGMLTGPQLRNYLEVIPVAAISEGAL